MINDTGTFAKIADYAYIQPDDLLGIYRDGVLSYVISAQNESGYYINFKFGIDVDIDSSITTNISFKFYDTNTNTVRDVITSDGTDLTAVKNFDVFGMGGITTELKFELTHN